MNIPDIFIELLILIFLQTGIIFFILKNWMLKKIQYSVKSKYDRQLEEYKNSINTRTKASLVADLLSEWISDPESQKQLNKLTFEAFLWLPKDIALQLSDLLSHKELNSSSVRDIIAGVRKHLLSEDEGIDAQKVVVFTQELERKQLKMKQQVTQ